MKFLLFILSLISLISLSTSLMLPSFKVGQKVSFNSLNCEFTFAYDGPNKNMLLMLFSHEKDNLSYQLTCPEEIFGGVHMDKDIGILNYISEGPCNLKLGTDKNDNGTFIFYDFKAKYKIKLRNKYGNINMDFSSRVSGDRYDSSGELKFLVPNFRGNLSIKFEYKEKAFYSFTNPFKVCHENVCEENISNYYFEEGNSYEIYVKAQKIKFGEEIDYMIAPFTFYPEDYNGTYYDDDLEYSYDKDDTSNNSKILLNCLLINSLLILLFI